MTTSKEFSMHIAIHMKVQRAIHERHCSENWAAELDPSLTRSTTSRHCCSRTRRHLGVCACSMCVVRITKSMEDNCTCQFRGKQDSKV